MDSPVSVHHVTYRTFVIGTSPLINITIPSTDRHVSEVWIFQIVVDCVGYQQYFHFKLVAMNNSYECLKGAQSYFSKFCCLFHLKNHHSKDVNLKFQLKRSSRLDLQSERNLLSMFANCKPFIREIFQLSYMGHILSLGCLNMYVKSHPYRFGAVVHDKKNGLDCERFLNHLRVIRCLTAHNWQKWKTVFLTCPCHKIYRDEAVGLTSCKYTWKITIFVKMWNLGQYRENLIFCQ